MDVLEIQDALNTFSIIADTREQNTPEAEARFKAFGVPVSRATLSYGDYCGQIMLPSGKLYDDTKTVCAKAVVERKMSLDELAGCFTRSRDRFKREFERAVKNDAKVYLLVEDGSFEAIMNKRYRSRFNPKAYMASLFAWTVRYNITPVFCKPGSSGKVIREILYRDIRERLFRGEFDDREATQ